VPWRQSTRFLLASLIEQDRYLFGVLIALAQARQYACSDDATARQSSHIVSPKAKKKTVVEVVGLEIKKRMCAGTCFGGFYRHEQKFDL
jgi:hypothetical protein